MLTFSTVELLSVLCVTPLCWVSRNNNIQAPCISVTCEHGNPQPAPSTAPPLPYKTHSRSRDFPLHQWGTQRLGTPLIMGESRSLHTMRASPRIPSEELVKTEARRGKYISDALLKTVENTGTGEASIVSLGGRKLFYWLPATVLRLCSSTLSTPCGKSVNFQPRPCEADVELKGCGGPRLSATTLSGYISPVFVYWQYRRCGNFRSMKLRDRRYDQCGREKCVW